MLITTKEKDTHEILVAFVVVALERAFPKPTEASTSDAPSVATPILGTISVEEAELNNMIVVVEVTGSPLTDAVMECLYGLHSPKKSQGLGTNADASSPNGKPKSLAETVLDTKVG